MFTQISDSDLFDEDHDFDALGHGVNLEGVMGSGIAVPFRRMYPNMFYNYAMLCQENRLPPGQVYPYFSAKDARWIYNCATQVSQGPNANYTLVALTAHHMLAHAQKNGVKSIGIPTIGCGIGGLEWPRVEYIYKSVFQGVPDVTLTVVHRK